MTLLQFIETSPRHQRSGHGQTETEAVDVAWWSSISDHEAAEMTVMGELWLRIICLLITE